MVKEAIGEGTANLFVEEYEHQGDFDPFVAEPVSVALAVALQQSVPFHLPEIVAKLIQAVAVGAEAEGCDDGGVDIFGPPASHCSTAVQEDLHQTDYAGVVDLDSGKLHGSNGDRQGQSLQQREVDMDVVALRLKTGKAVRDLDEPLPNFLEVAQAFPQAEVGKIVRANLVAQKQGELFILLDECVLPIRPEDVMAMFHLLQRRVQLALHLLCNPAAEDLGDLARRHSPQTHLAGALEYLVDRARAAGMSEAFLEVRPSNTAAIRLYQSMGFEQVGIRRGYYQAIGGREDASVLKLVLPARRSRSP